MSDQGLRKLPNLCLATCSPVLLHSRRGIKYVNQLLGKLIWAVNYRNQISQPVQLSVGEQLLSLIRQLQVSRQFRNQHLYEDFFLVIAANKSPVDQQTTYSSLILKPSKSSDRLERADTLKLYVIVNYWRKNGLLQITKKHHFYVFKTDGHSSYVIPPQSTDL